MKCLECERLRQEEGQATVNFVNAEKSLDSFPPDAPLEEWAACRERHEQAEAAWRAACQRVLDHQRQHPN